MCATTGSASDDDIRGAAGAYGSGGEVRLEVPAVRNPV